MFSFISVNTLIAAGAATLLIALFKRGLGKGLLPFLLRIPPWIEEKFRIRLPPWFNELYLKAATLSVAVLNDLLCNRQMLTMVVNRIRKNQGDAAVQVFLDYASKIDLSRFEELMPSEIKQWYNLAREDAAVELIAADVKKATPLLPPEQQKVVLQMIEEPKLREVVRAAVVSQKAEAVAKPVEIPAAKQAEIKAHLGFLSTEGQRAIEELRAKHALAK